MKKTTTLGHSNFEINRIGLGCMGMSEFYGSFNEEESIKSPPFQAPEKCTASKRTWVLSM